MFHQRLFTMDPIELRYIHDCTSLQGVSIFINLLFIHEHKCTLMTQIFFFHFQHIQSTQHSSILQFNFQFYTTVLWNKLQAAFEFIELHTKFASCLWIKRVLEFEFKFWVFENFVEWKNRLESILSIHNQLISFHSLELKIIHKLIDTSILRLIFPIRKLIGIQRSSTRIHTFDGMIDNYEICCVYYRPIDCGRCSRCLYQ